MYSKEAIIRENIDEIKKMLEENKPLREIARHFGMKHDTLVRNLKKLDVPYSTNQGRKGMRHWENRKSSWFYLGTSNYIASRILKEKLIEDGIKKCECECCKQTTWMGKQIPLELHHINGDHYDNRLENLEILCSNCHSQKHGYFDRTEIDKNTGEIKIKKKKAKVIRKKVKHICPVCQREFDGVEEQRYCSYECLHKSQQKNKEGVTKKQIIDLFKTEGSFVGVGKKLNMSDNAVRKWCRKYKLPTTTGEMKKYIDRL